MVIGCTRNQLRTLPRRGELVDDDIGNRTTAEGKVYTANNLNQYTAIDTFEPQYDADGNQTLIKTSTGVWSVTYNAENRPVRWERGSTVVTMDFDRMGRRVFYKEEVDGEVTKHHRFVYDNYLCVQKLDALNNDSQINLFVWDPTEPVATRPLFMVANPGSYKFFYTFDGNKNVSELVHFESRNGIAAHYDYAPFGAVTRAVNTSAISARNFAAENTFRFSSEYHDETLGLVYYNYRHYNPTDGRWMSQDLIGVVKQCFGYRLLENDCISRFDRLGLWTFSIGISGNVGACVGLTGNFSIVISYSKEKGLQVGSSVTTGGGSVVGAGTSALITIAVSGAPEIQNLEGGSMSVGVSVGEFLGGGGDISIPLDMNCGYWQYSGSFGIMTGTFAEGHANVTVTETWRWFTIGGEKSMGEQEHVVRVPLNRKDVEE